MQLIRFGLIGLFFFIFSLSNAQNTSLFVGFKSGVYFGSKKSTNLYNGTGTHGIVSVYDRPNLEALITQELVHPYVLSEYPTSMRYAPALTIGGTLGLILKDGSAFFLSADIINLNTEDAYTVLIDDPNVLEATIRSFAIMGEEKRLNIDFGYKAFFESKNENISPFFTIGINALYTEFEKNELFIGNLGPYTIFPENFQGQFARRSGFGLGGFGGLGLNYGLSDKTSIELEYSLKYSTINYGSTKFNGINHALSLAFIWGK